MSRTVIVYINKPGRAGEREIGRGGNRQGVNRLQSAEREAFLSRALPPFRAPGFSRSLLIATSAIVLAAGCADLRWHKDAAEPAALARDLDECTQIARARAAREAWLPGASLPRIVGSDPRGRAIVSAPGRDDSERFLLEHDLVRLCMGERGYELVPAITP